MEFFVDSSIFVEAFKKSSSKEHKIAKSILEVLLKEVVLFYPINVNSVVWDETVFHLIVKGKAYDKSLVKEFLKHLFSLFDWLEINKKVGFLGLSLIEKHNLKTHDALILATCKHYGVKYLISIDSDFLEPCQKEGIILIDSPEKLKEILETR